MCLEDHRAACLGIVDEDVTIIAASSDHVIIAAQEISLFDVSLHIGVTHVPLRCAMHCS